MIVRMLDRNFYFVQIFPVSFLTSFIAVYIQTLPCSRATLKLESGRIVEQ